MKDARQYKEFTRAELAKYAFVSEEHVEEFEESRAVPGFDTTLLICHFLDIEVDWSWLRLCSLFPIDGLLLEHAIRAKIFCPEVLSRI